MADPRAPSEATRLLIAAAIALAILVLSGLALGQELPAGSTFDARTALERSQAAIGTRLGDHVMIDGDGRPVRLSTFRGRPLILSFVYTGCFQVCPATTRFLERAVREAHRALGPGSFNVVTVGFNQPFDTPSAMRDFQKRQGIDTAGWYFLAGNPESIAGLARDVGFAWVTSASGFDHVTQATIVTADGRVAQQVYGDSFELSMFVDPLKELVTGQPMPVRNLGDLVERVRILCTVYDPRVGRYRLDYALFIELFVGATILGAIAWFLAAEWRRQRKIGCTVR